MAASLYGLAAFAVLRVLVPVRFGSESPATDGECTACVTPPELFGLVAAPAVAAALVAAIVGPRRALPFAMGAARLWHGFTPRRSDA